MSKPAIKTKATQVKQAFDKIGTLSSNKFQPVKEVNKEKKETRGRKSNIEEPKRQIGIYLTHSTTKRMDIALAQEALEAAKSETNKPSKSDITEWALIQWMDSKGY